MPGTPTPVARSTRTGGPPVRWGLGRWPRNWIRPRCCLPYHLLLVLVARALPYRLERRSELLSENPRLLPCREVAALFRLVVIDEVGVRPLGPTAWRLVLLPGKDA